MDPVTLIGLIASLANLVEASGSVLKVIKTFKDGDKGLANLSNDMSVFMEALYGFDRVLRSRHTLHRISGSVIESTLQNSMITLKDIETRLLQISGVTVSAVRRAKWAQQASSIKKLHERLKEQNAMLQTFLTITHAETFLAVASQYPQYMLLCSSAKEPSMEQEGAEDPTVLQIPRLDSGPRRLSVASSLATVDSISDASTTSTSSLSVISSRTSISGSSLSRQSSEETVPAGVQRLPERPLIVTRRSDEPIYGSHRRYSSANSQDDLIVRRSCRYDCHCKCHEQQVAKHRKGLSKLRSSRLNCTEPSCQENAAAADNYAEQSKSFRKALSQVMSAKSIKVRYNLNTYRMVPEGSDAMRYVKHGQLEKLQASIESGEATIWDTAPDGWSLLHTAAYNRQLPIVKYLLKLGVDTEVGDIGSRKPADLAILKSIGQDATDVEQDIVDVFTEKDDYLTDFDFTPIHVAVLELYDHADRERPSLEQLVQLLDDANNAPVHTNWAEWKSQFKTRSPLFAAVLEFFRASAFEQPKGSKIIHNLLDRKDKKYSWTPLHWAASAGRVEKMKTLVEHGANPLLLSNLNANILHAAAESRIDRGLAGALEIWKRCSGKLDIDQANRWIETPLHVAAWCSAACVKLLLDAGADPNVRQEDGQVPLHCAGLSGREPDRREIVSLLCSAENKEHINTQDFDGRPPLFDFLDDSDCVDMLCRHGAKLSYADSSGKNVFHHACLQDEPEALRIILRIASDAKLAIRKDQDGNTPLMEALSNGHVDCAVALLELEDVGDPQSTEGWAAAHYAAKIGDADLLEAVLKHPSFVKGVKTGDGKGADTIAMEAGNWSGRVKELIKQYDYFGWKD